MLGLQYCYCETEIIIIVVFLFRTGGLEDHDLKNQTLHHQERSALDIRPPSPDGQHLQTANAKFFIVDKDGLITKGRHNLEEREEQAVDILISKSCYERQCFN